MEDEKHRINEFLKGSSFAVIGASADRSKYGNKVLRCYLQHRLRAVPVNPNMTEIEGEPCFQLLSDLCTTIHGVSIITPPEVTNQVIEEVIELGIEHVWIQPGAESPWAISRAKEAGINCISGGACVLVALGYRDNWKPA